MENRISTRGPGSSRPTSITEGSVREILTTDVCGFEVSKQQKPLYKSHMNQNTLLWTGRISRFEIQSVPGGKVNILRGHSVGHSKQKVVYVHVSYSERFPR
jgi:hypothetical protein